MRKILFMLAALLSLPLASNAQWHPNRSGTVVYTFADPTGNACANDVMWVYEPSGALFTCQSGVVAAVGGGGGSGASPVYTQTEYSLGTCTTAATINGANGNRQVVTLTDADTCALSFTQPSAKTVSITLKIIQSSAGAFSGGISGCKWPGGITPTITQTAAAVDFVSIYLDGTNAYCVVSQDFR